MTVDERPDPEVVRAALATFLHLPIGQRSAVILKDVLGCTLEEIVREHGVEPAGREGGARTAAGRRCARAPSCRRDAAPRIPQALAEERALLHRYAAPVQRARLGGAAPVLGRGLPPRSRVAHRAARPGGRGVLRALRGAGLPCRPRAARRRRRRAAGAGGSPARHQRAAEHVRAARMAGRSRSRSSATFATCPTSPPRCSPAPRGSEADSTNEESA